MPHIKAELNDEQMRKLAIAVKLGIASCERQARRPEIPEGARAAFKREVSIYREVEQKLGLDKVYTGN